MTPGWMAIISASAVYNVADPLLLVGALLVRSTCPTEARYGPERKPTPNVRSNMYGIEPNSSVCESAAFHELAWAAGFFDGDGCFTVKKVPANFRLIASITQAPESPGAVPAVLDRFRRVVRTGTIGGPSPANHAYWWTTTSTLRTLQVMRWIRPWLGATKVTQFEGALERVITSHRERRRPIGARSVAYHARIQRLDMIRTDMSAMGSARADPSSELAWAAGFFDAEGSTFNRIHNDGCRTRLKLTAKVGQSTADGSVAEVLARFGRAVGAGYLNGPYVDRGRLPHHEWRTSSYEGVIALHQAICPWLGPVKRAQAHEAVRRYLDYRSTPRGSGYGLEPLSCGRGSMDEGPSRFGTLGGPGEQASKGRLAQPF